MQEPSDRQLLEFESRFYAHYGAKITAIREELGIGDTRYWQRMVAIVAAPDPELAVEFGPLLRRLRRILDARVRTRLPRSA